GLACALGVFVGSFGWFALVAQLTHKGKHVLGDKAAWIPRVVGIALMVYARHGRNVPIPFGPYLGAAGVVALFWGPQLTRQYFSQFM
ncbi:MAG TPA: hypothetical protein VFA36_08760, partial [Burkholderiales bacterium]|nr:hypothetical protein [Burkholderiales bacterium]